MVIVWLMPSVLFANIFTAKLTYGVKSVSANTKVIAVWTIVIAVRLYGELSLLSWISPLLPSIPKTLKIIITSPVNGAESSEINKFISHIPAGIYVPILRFAISFANPVMSWYEPVTPGEIVAKFVDWGLLSINPSNSYDEIGGLGDWL